MGEAVLYKRARFTGSLCEDVYDWKPRCGVSLLWADAEILAPFVVHPLNTTSFNKGKEPHQRAIKMYIKK